MIVGGEAESLYYLLGCLEILKINKDLVGGIVSEKFY